MNDFLDNTVSIAEEKRSRRKADVQGIIPQAAEDAIALEFSCLHMNRLRYVAAWSRWLIRETDRWRIDDTIKVFDLARAVCRTHAQASPDESESRRIASASTISAVERLARSDRRHAARPEDFDTDPWQLNTPDGAVDLRTGQLRPHSSGDDFSKVTAVSPYGECPLWHEFLAQTCGGDHTLIEYIQRWAGYTLTGAIREHAFLFLHGPGGNGKSVLIGTLAKILNEYATAAMADVFTAGRSDQHPAHLAALRGARMVIITETDEGRPWAEARIKSLTGGDTVSARVMRGNPFEFEPIFKLWVCGNHRPTLRNPDPAMRRRLHLVPLTHVPAAADPELPEKLRAEWPGILAWAVEGCLAWQKHGLAVPPSVESATNEYFSHQDTLAEWIDERCEKVRGATMPARTAYADWKTWAGVRGEDPGTEKRFSGELERRFTKQRTKAG